MGDRPPFQLNTAILVFNLFQIGYNIYIFVGGMKYGWAWNYNFLCQPIDHSATDEYSMGMARMVWHYYMCKLVDLLDTVIFVLRKKNQQVSYLHIIHHFGMPFVAFFCVKYYPGGHGTFTGFLNTPVHVVMYTYYLVASLGPQYRKYLWWKKYLTMAQMTQFLLIAIHSSLVFLPGCEVDSRPYYFFLPNTLMMFFMFASFYHQTYSGKKTS
ncbi:very long chain fatty acid elongase AAEL008004-like isoform X2 [Bacillus rossius redtenbacheri]